MELRRLSKIVPQTASLKQTLKNTCSNFGRKHRCDEADYSAKVPRGHFAVYVGKNRSRYVIPISCLAHSEFQFLLEIAAEEYGFRHATGLTIPCDETFFQSLVSLIAH